MIEISNRQYDILIDKLPRLIALARSQPATTLKQSEAIRQLHLLHQQLKRKRQKRLPPEHGA